MGDRWCGWIHRIDKLHYRISSRGKARSWLPATMHAYSSEYFTDRSQNLELEAYLIWLCNDFRLHNLNHKPIIPLNPVCKNSKKPNLGWVKINVDATVSNGRMGFGVIARDDEGFVVGGCGGSKESTQSCWR
ncbi:hypothetical protein Gotur_005469 [Gossypium turneri]